MNFENSHWYDETVSGFVLFPSHSQSVCIHPELDIYIELVQEKEVQDESKEKQVKASSSKQFTFRLSKPGKAHLSTLSKFIESCVTAYTEYLEDKQKKQTIYEYERSRKDDDGFLSLCFQESPFHSNKTFDNLFIENKCAILKSIREFSKYNPNKKEVEARYKRQGIPYKRTYLLHGPPGTGKSSLIKAFLNETGRHCIMVPWSRIKTASDFTNLCRTHHKKLTQKDVILVFEDFDANSSKTIKAREALQEPVKKDENDTNKKEENFLKNTLENMVKFSTLPLEKDDEFTLECVLNTLDGVHELYDAVIVFTTNDIGSLDPAFLRPGRIDQIIHMDLAGPPIIKKMVEHFFQEKSEKIWDIHPNCKVAPAHIQEICIRNCSKGIDAFFDDLYEQSKLSSSL
jgi:chaperone BCS1